MGSRRRCEAQPGLERVGRAVLGRGSLPPPRKRHPIPPACPLAPHQQRWCPGSLAPPAPGAFGAVLLVSCAVSEDAAWRRGKTRASKIKILSPVSVHSGPRPRSGQSWSRSGPSGRPWGTHSLERRCGHRCRLEPRLAVQPAASWWKQLCPTRSPAVCFLTPAAEHSLHARGQQRGQISSRGPTHASLSPRTDTREGFPEEWALCWARQEVHSRRGA